MLAKHAVLPQWRAVLAALEDDHAAADAHLQAAGEADVAATAPWRTVQDTRRLLAAIRDGRPADGRPFVAD